MRFEDVRGHEHALGQLRAAVATRPASAWLLVGPSGIGKRRVAEALASRLLCEAAAGDDACGHCRHCTRVASGTHPDLHVVTRDDDRRDIRIDQIRSLIGWFALRPMMAARKVALIDGAQDMNEAGQNALLKTLEEPPGDAVIILTSTGLGRLLPTVRSRCRLLRLDPLPTDLVAAILEETGMAEADAARIAPRSGGSVGMALALADPALEAIRARTFEVLAGLPDAIAADLSAFAAEIGRGDTAAGLAAVLSWHRDLLHLAIDGPDAAVANVDHRPALEAAAARRTPATALRLLEVVCDTVDAVDRNANKTLAIETMLLALRRLYRHDEHAPWTSRTT